jgi:hypothetical protein
LAFENFEPLARGKAEHPLDQRPVDPVATFVDDALTRGTAAATHVLYSPTYVGSRAVCKHGESLTYVKAQLGHRRHIRVDQQPLAVS